MIDTHTWVVFLFRKNEILTWGSDVSVLEDILFLVSK